MCVGQPNVRSSQPRSSLEQFPYLCHAMLRVLPTSRNLSAGKSRKAGSARALIKKIGHSPPDGARHRWRDGTTWVRLDHRHRDPETPGRTAQALVRFEDADKKCARTTMARARYGRRGQTVCLACPTLPPQLTRRLSNATANVIPRPPWASHAGVAPLSPLLASGGGRIPERWKSAVFIHSAHVRRAL